MNLTGKMYDLSVTLSSGMPAWPSDPGIVIKPTGTVSEDGYSMEKYSASTHSGTHIDAPSHMVGDGLSVDLLPLDNLVGEGYCIRPDINGTEINHDSLRKAWRDEYDGHIVLLFTGWDRKRSFSREFQYDFPGLSRDSVAFFTEHHTRMIGIDTLGIEPYDHTDYYVHRGLLEAGIPLIEDLAGLNQLQEGKKYLIAALPVKIKGGSGSMARVIAMELSE